MINNINKYQVKCPSPVTAMVGFPNDTNERTWPGSIIMSKRIEYTKGEIVGNCYFIKETFGYSPRKAIFKCGYCSSTFEANIDNVKWGGTKSCGCMTKKLMSRESHSMSKTKEYRMWNNIKGRCFNKSDGGFFNYGGRGIGMYIPWVIDFVKFYTYISKLPNYGAEGMTLDRIDNDGNYEPGNLRWATKHIQSVNQKMPKNNTVGYVGITKTRERYLSRICVHYKRICLGYFNSLKDAVEARNQYIIHNKLTEYKIQKHEE